MPSCYDARWCLPCAWNATTARVRLAGEPMGRRRWPIRTTCWIRGSSSAPRAMSASMDRTAMSSSSVSAKVTLRAGALPLLAAALSAQQPIAPTPDAVGSQRGENVAGYNIVNSFETGYRFSSIDGNLGKYRSDVNYGNGLRLLSSQLSVHSLDGKGGLFDEIVLTTLGLGNDPYQSALLRIQKNAWYRYDMQWRL